MRFWLLILLLGLPTASFGQEMASSLRPVPNPRLHPVAVADAVPPPDEAAVIPRIRPLRNPRYAALPDGVDSTEGEAAAVEDVPRIRPLRNPRYAEPVVVAGEVEPSDIITPSLRPLRRPKALSERIAALKAASNAPGLGVIKAPEEESVDLASIAPPSRKERRKKKRELESMVGAVCGVPAIKGEEIAPIESNISGCGIAEAVAITSVAGVQLSQKATVECSIAKALNSWVNDVAQPAFDGKLTGLRVAAHYTCRSRNNIKGAKISEHGKGKAIDISAFILADGQILTVKENYQKLLRKIYKAACPFFRTTLGPGSDGYHEDHFHFDTSARSGGSYCR